MYSGKRSREAKNKRAKKKQDNQLASNIVMDYSLRDYDNGEIVFSAAPYAATVKYGGVTVNNATFEDVVHLKIREALGYVPACATNHDYGEVLNVKRELLFTIKTGGRYKHV